jgi:hypothetical protein
MNLRSRVQNFNKRWNIEYDQQKRIEDFKNRVLITLEIYVKRLFTNKNNLGLLIDYLKLIASHLDFDKLDFLWSRNGGGKYFMDEVKSKLLSADLPRTLFLLQNLFYIDISESIKDEIYEEFNKDFEMSLLDINIKKTKSLEYIFYQKGAKLLDEMVVNDILDWLDKYPEPCKKFVSALQKYQNHEDMRAVLDDLRLSLELLLKKILNNKTRLEKQTEPLGKYLKNKGTSEEVRNMFTTLLSYYAKYQDEYVKHNDKTKNIPEVEFIIYLTGTFMRLLLSL